MTTLLRQSRGGGGKASSSSGGERGVRVVHIKGFTTINIGDCNGKGSDYDDN